ncbi:metallophosphoesterase [Gangjinia marincola]|uniref:Metallophosphoesterase n=1 Tax=Gangjinia marincola TaxID=578463 RepID=A0ABN1MG55_9FLAO
MSRKLKSRVIIFLILSVSITLNAQKAKYRKGEENYEKSFTQNTNPLYTFYLIGDVGKAYSFGPAPGLAAFENHIKSTPTSTNSHTIYLGDNIYPKGLSKKDASTREYEELVLDLQVNAIKNFKGKTIFIPGNHDWYNNGLEGLKRQEKYIEDKLGKNTFIPENGCPIKSIEVNDEVQLIVLDSNWFLTDWDDHPLINDECDQIKSREAFLLEFDSELKKSQGKVRLVALHHPLYTNGVHGGQYGAKKHLYPTQKKIPLPILASLAVQIRSNAGLTIQDNHNPFYQDMVNRLSTIAKKYDNVIFSSGHEHSLQYIEHDGIKQIVTGAGAKNSYANLNNDGLFAYPGQGFAVLEVFENHEAWVSYYGSVEDQPKLLYRKQVLKKEPPYDDSALPASFPATVNAKIYDEDLTDRSGFFKFLWGDHYRDLYGTNVNVPTAVLDTLYGGLEVVRGGGGQQTRSIRVKTRDGREYNMRALKKSATQFLQAAAFKESFIEDDFENTVATDLLFDFYTAAHPYAFMVIPSMSDAIGLYHTNPKLFYLPKQKALGKYNKEFGDELVMIVERPMEAYNELESFGKPQDIESTADLYERLRRDEEYTVDEPAYIKARLFDMIIGDWDRHQDQWRWSEFEDENGVKSYRPIPRDRDQVFSKFDGAIMNTIRGLAGFAKKFSVYNGKIGNVGKFNTSGMLLDRSLIRFSGKEEWIKQAKFIKKNLTDEAIEKGFEAFPEEIKVKTDPKLVDYVKQRRDDIVKYAEAYYKELAALGIIFGTDKDDFIEIERLAKGKTKVTISRIKDGEKADKVSEKIYDKKDTSELWVYALDDDDIIHVYGEGNNPIYSRIIGGQNNDIYRIDNGKKVKLYDFKSKKNTLEKKNGADVSFTDDYHKNVYDKTRNRFTSNVILPTLGFNPDDGISVRVQNIYTVKGFEQKPFTQRHKVSAGYYLATSGYTVGYEGEFLNVIGDFNLMAQGSFTSPNFARNFFGFGNGSENPEDDRGLNFNRVKIAQITGGLGLVRRGRLGSEFKIQTTFETFEVEDTNNRFITEAEAFDESDDIFEQQYFASITTSYEFASYDNKLNPTRGMLFQLNGGASTNIDNENTFGRVGSHIEFFNSLTTNRKLVLRTKLDAATIIGEDYEFYQAAVLGADTGLRGYRRDRFNGETAFAGGADLRYSFNKLKTTVLPLDMGLYVGSDIGRVWTDLPNESETWHPSYGLGFWVNTAQAAGINANVFFTDEGARVGVTVGFNL